MSSAPELDYIAVGHVTIDVVADGERRAGGSALYGALQAARLGLRALVLTRGVPAEIEALLSPFAGELELRVQPAQETTTLQTVGMGSARRQHVLAWAGEIERAALPSARVLHLAPVARELRWRADPGAGFLGMTPQGLVRRWSHRGGELRSVAAGAEEVAVARGCDALVISRHEREVCARLITEARSHGALVAVTAGHAPTEVLLADGERIEVPVEPVSAPADDLGAGDVYACALFITLAEGGGVSEAVELAGDAAALRMLGVGPAAVASRALIGQLRARRAGAG